MEYVGFTMLLIGMAGMDGNRKIAVGLIIVGCLFIYLGEKMSELIKYRREARRIAKQLQYADEVQQSLNKAKSEAEICRIMTTARHKMKGDYIWR